jgi:hypothetical protein
MRKRYRAYTREALESHSVVGEQAVQVKMETSTSVEAERGSKMGLSVDYRQNTLLSIKVWPEQGHL